MADSPQLKADGQVNFIVKADGNALANSIVVTSIKVTHAVNRIPSATLVIFDGDMDSKTFELSDKADFTPGKTIEISAGYGSAALPIFSGIVVKQGISIGGQGRSYLKLVCMDECRQMSVNRHNANFIKQKDSQIITQLIGAHSGLTADVTATDLEHEEMVQYNCSDWDFMLSRAEANGCVVIVEDGKVSVAPPKAQSPQLLVTWSNDLIDFEADMDAGYQYTSVEAVGWDIKTQKPITETAKSEPITKQGNIDSAVLAKTLGGKPYQLQSTTPLEKNTLKDWAKAQQVKSTLARIRGKMSFPGNAKAKPGTSITVKGVGKRFEGDVYVSQVEHQLGDGFWRSDVQFGMSPKWSAEYRDLSAPPASGLMPPIEGLQIGTVLAIVDKKGQFRIQVDVPVMQAKTKGVWARLAGVYATKKAGYFFMPEIGDEVVLGYFNNNPCDPVILGSLFSSAHEPPYTPAKENETKAIVSKSELKIIFDDKDKVMTLTTPGKNMVVIDDKKKSIELTDENGNSIEMSSKGIELKSIGYIKLTAKTDITLDASAGVTLKAATDLTASGASVKMTATGQLTAKGGSGAELSASGTTVIKGAMVNIN
jgi:Rhs element Vgr protein